MTAVEIRPVRSLISKQRFVDFPFRVHRGDPNWVPPLRLGIYDRLSKRHPATTHQRWELWMAYRRGKPVGRIGACVDTMFDKYQGVRWGWVGFYDSFDDPDVSAALFDVALDWCRRQGAESAIGPGNFTTNDELGLLVEGHHLPASVLTLQNPPYYERLWTEAGWEQAMDLWGFKGNPQTTALSERQLRRLEQIGKRAGVTVRTLRTEDWDAEVKRFFELYNASWQRNWGFAPLPEPEVVHIAKQLKQIIRPEWVFALEREGEPVAVSLTLPDVNKLILRARSGRLLPFNWIPLLTGPRRLRTARVWALGVRPDVEHLGLGPMLYHATLEGLIKDGVTEAELSWTLSTNDRINKQILAMGGVRHKVWRLYKQELN